MPDMVIIMKAFNPRPCPGESMVDGSGGEETITSGIKKRTPCPSRDTLPVEAVFN